MNIRRIVATDFRRSDIRVFQEFAIENKPFIRGLAAKDIVVFISKKGDQMLFIHGFTQFSDGTALQSIRHRIVGGTWNPLMLSNYASAAGLEVEGLHKFEEHFLAQRKRKAAAAS